MRDAIWGVQVMLNSVSRDRSAGLATANEVAEYLRTTKNQLARLRYEGYGPKYCKLGSSVRYRWEDVYRWVDGNIQFTSETPP